MRRVGAPLRGPLIELVGEQWAFTDAGIESLTGDTFVAADMFPDTITRFQDPGTLPFVPPDVPPGVSKNNWQMLMQIGVRTYLGQGERLPSRKGIVLPSWR